jgi:hypothetical protein
MNSESLFEKELRDLTVIEGAGFNARETLLAKTAAFTLHYLRGLSSKLGKPIDKISIQDIVAEIIKARPA